MEKNSKKNMLYKNNSFTSSPLNLYIANMLEKNAKKESEIKIKSDVEEKKTEQKETPKKEEKILSKIKSLSFDFLDEYSFPKMNFNHSKSELCLHDDFEVI